MKASIPLRCFFSRGICRMVIICLAVPGGGIPVKAADYYVATWGKDIQAGTIAQPWEHLAYAAQQAQAGDTVHIEGGNYGHEHMEIAHSGTEESPLVFEAYNGMAELDGQDQTGNGIYLASKQYVVLRNFKLQHYDKGLRAQGCDHIILDNINLSHMGTESPWTGQGISFANVTYSTVKNCQASHCTIHDLYLWDGGFNLITDNIFYIDTGEELSADYGVYTGGSHDNIFQHCIVENRHPLIAGHHGHGIALRVASYNNHISNCVSYGLLEHWVVGEEGYNNEFVNCTAYDAGAYTQLGLYTHALVSRMGAHDNRFISCASLEVRHGISLWTDSATIQQNNHYQNCRVRGAEFAIFLYNATGNQVSNCLLVDSDYLFLVKQEQDNTLGNSIITQVKHDYYGGGTWEEPTVTQSYCNFWDNGYSAGNSTGNMQVDPLFADAENGDYHLKSQYGRWSATAWVYDRETSPCIDAGDPASGFSQEPEPNGQRINMSVYGNTAEASKSQGTGTTAPASRMEKTTVSPNPYIKGRSHEQKICFGNLPREAVIRIYTASGELIVTLRYKESTEGGSEEWDISGKSTGIYLYSILSPAGNKTGKISLLK